MKMKLIFNAIFESLVSSVVLILTIVFVLSSLNSKVLYKLSFIFIILEALFLALGYFKIIKNISTKQKIVIFSLINVLSFLFFLIAFFVVDIYFPSFISPKQDVDVSDGIGILQIIVMFIVTSFVCRLIGVIKTIKSRRQSEDG